MSNPSVTFSPFSWYSPDYLSGGGSTTAGIGAGAAMLASKERAFDLSHLCNAPVNGEAKNTRHDSPVEDRWLAAQQALNLIIMQKLITQYSAAVNGLSFLIDGKVYKVSG